MKVIVERLEPPSQNYKSQISLKKEQVRTRSHLATFCRQNWIACLLMLLFTLHEKKLFCYAWAQYLIWTMENYAYKMLIVL